MDSYTNNSSEIFFIRYIDYKPINSFYFNFIHSLIGLVKHKLNKKYN